MNNQSVTIPALYGMLMYHTLTIPVDGGMLKYHTLTISVLHDMKGITLEYSCSPWYAKVL
jgi:hypothetical protein